MAITTLNGIIEGMQQPVYAGTLAVGTVVAMRPETLWALAGASPAGSYDTTLNGVTLSSPVTGQILFNNPTSGSAYLSRVSIGSSVKAGLLLCDRLWHNGGIDDTITTPQAITSPTWPARDINGTSNGEGVFLALEVSATVGAATPNITVSYTNSAGTSGRTGTNIIATTASVPPGATYFISLQDGDLGVKSVESITLDASWISGTINLVAFRPILFIDLKNSPTYNDIIDGVNGCLPKLFNNSVPYFICIPSTTGFVLNAANLIWSHG